jgi:tetratricopeptide (TPR) repeat protein
MLGAVSRLRVLLLVACLTSPVPLAGQAPRDVHAEAGWAALETGDGNRAAAAFEAALKRNPQDPMLIFGAGAAAYLQGRLADAREKLTLAFTLNPRLISAAELLGEIDYQQGDVEGAIRRYEEILPYAAHLTASMQKRLDAWRKEASVHRKLSRAGTARFSIAFDGRSNDALATHALGVLDRAFQRIADQLGAYPPDRILVILYTERQFYDLTHGPDWSAGLFDGQIRIPTQGAAQNWERFDQVLIHELGHAMIASLAPRGVPAWLHEGLASYFEPDDVGGALARAHASGAVIPLSQLEQGFGRFSAAQARAAYDQSLVAADLLARIVGTRMAALLRALGRGQTFSEAMSVAGLRASEFEEQLRRRLRP